MTLITPIYSYIPLPTADRSVFGAKVYIGRPNTDPLQSDNQLQVRVVQANNMFVNVPQPIESGPGGVLLVDGSPAQLDIESSQYSITILDASDVQLYSFANVTIPGAVGRAEIIAAGGLPFDDTIEFSGATLTIDPALHTNALIAIDASDGAVSVSLPSASLTGNKFRFKIKKVDTSANQITIDPDGSDRVEGAATLTMAEHDETVALVCDGVNDWFAEGQFVRQNRLRLRAVETRSSTNETNIATNATDIAALENLPRVYATARTGPTGTATYLNGLTVTRNATGQYTYTFVTPIPVDVGGRYTVHAIPVSNRIYSVSNISATGFRLNFNIIQQPSGDTPSDVGHHVVVIADPSVFAAL